MKNESLLLDRRQFAFSAAVAATSLIAPGRSLASADEARRFSFCAFIKFLQALSYDELAEQIAELGFDGVEVTVREKEGYIHPEQAPDELPRFQEALKQHGLETMILTTDIVRADQPYAESTLRTAALLKIPRYRLGFLRYDLKRPILSQLADFQDVFRDVATMNRELEIAAVYQNHAGAQYLGATIWDLHSLIKNIPLEEIGCVFDIRHAMVEAGQAWPVFFDLMKPHLGAISVKDYRWNGRKPEHVPLGEGRVDPDFFPMLLKSDYAGPISVHVEYLPEDDAATNLAALKRDLDVLRKWL